VNLKHRRRQIETDERRQHRTISVMKGTYPSGGTAVPDAGGRPSHHAESHMKNLVGVEPSQIYHEVFYAARIQSA
jgi:hypothetical protein